MVQEINWFEYFHNAFIIHNLASKQDAIKNGRYTLIDNLTETPIVHTSCPQNGNIYWGDLLTYV